MPDMYACCKFSNQTGQYKQQLKSVDLSSNVSELRQRVREIFGLQENEFDLVYRGRYLRDGTLLSTCQVSDGCTVHVLKRVHHDPPTAEPLDEALIAQVVRAMKQIVRAPASRSALERVIANPDTVKELIGAAPSLASDPVAMAIFQDREMLVLSTMADRESMNKMLNAHPSLGHAALHLASTVNAEVVRAAKDGGSAVNQSALNNPRVQYGLDQMSDEDDDDDDEGSVGPAPRAGPSGGQQISADFFRQAMQMVYSGATQPPSSSSMPQQQQSQQPQVTEAMLQQLRDMGILDEALARRALEMTGGNIQLALEYIFGDDSIS